MKKFLHRLSFAALVILGMLASPVVMPTSQAKADGPCYADSTEARVHDPSAFKDVDWTVIIKCTSRSNYVFNWKTCEAVPFLPDPCSPTYSTGSLSVGPYSYSGPTAAFLYPYTTGCDRDRDTNYQYWNITYKSVSSGILHSIGNGGRVATHLSCSSLT